MTDHERIIGRARAAFLGLALGDALGATTEFMTPTEIRSRFKVHRQIVGGGWLYLKPGRVTDDTEMSLAIARAILRKEGWNLREIANELVAWMRSKPVDIGATVRKGLRNVMLKEQLETPYNDGDAGNGAAMRMAPVALFTFGDNDKLYRHTLEQARITHNHPLSDAGSFTIGRMLHAALLGEDRFALHEITRELVAEHPKFRFNEYRGAASGYVVETLQTVFHYFFSTASFEECLTGVVNQGGDADTTGAIAGMIAGAFYGPEGLPPRWIKRLDPDVRKEVQAAGAALVKLSPWGMQNLQFKKRPSKTFTRGDQL